MCREWSTQQLRDAEERLSNAYKLIEELTEKLRRASDGSSGRGSVAQMLQKIREQLNAEFERYRCDTEESMKRTLTEMKMRLDQRLRENQRLQEEKDRMEDMLAKIKGELNQIQSQVLYVKTRFTDTDTLLKRTQQTCVNMTVQ